MKGELFAQIHAITRQIPDRENRRSIDLDAKAQDQWRAIVATTGEMQAFMSHKGELNSRQREIKWYVMK